jgi:hypothetical protein
MKKWIAWRNFGLTLEGKEKMAKPDQKKFKQFCRSQARKGLMNDPDGKWINEKEATSMGATASFQHLMGGYRIPGFSKSGKGEEKEEKK